MLEKKVCLITGASSGIGENLARILIKQGWIVIGIGRRLERLTALQQELGVDVFYPFFCDVTKP